MTEAIIPSYSQQAEFADLFLGVMRDLHRQDQTEERDPIRLLQELSIRLRSSEREARELGFPSEAIEAAKFAVCAWCDEYIMNTNWPGVSETWAFHLMQKRFFRTNLAGQQFFERMDALSGTSLLAQPVYAFCLATGFKGRYVYDLDLDQLDGVRKKSLGQALMLTGLNDPGFATFPSLAALRSSRYNSISSTHWLRIVFAILLIIAIASQIFSALLHNQVNLILQSWK